jgi:hypothetical protein
MHKQSQIHNNNPEQSGKVDFINFFSDFPASLPRSYSTFPLCSGTTLIKILVYEISHYRRCIRPTM